MFFKDKKEYEEYLKKNEIETFVDGQENYFNWTEDGYIKLEKNKFLKSNKDVSNVPLYPNKDMTAIINPKNDDPDSPANKYAGLKL